MTPDADASGAPKHHEYPERSLGTALRTKRGANGVIDGRPDHGLVPSGEAAVPKAFEAMESTFCRGKCGMQVQLNRAMIPEAH
ncbi:MAG TPA: hypothetical protein VFK31_11430, partial [Rhodanobacteraceae bacterium]|nr:hypothetical protein [Rhodanobacteraceae bacterium]